MRQAAVAAVRAETQRAIETSARLMEQLAVSEVRAYRKILKTRETIAATRRFIEKLRDVRIDIGQFGSD